jgi:hypothetical protein
MAAVLASIIAVLGTLGGVTATYFFQGKIRVRQESEARDGERIPSARHTVEQHATNRGRGRPRAPESPAPADSGPQTAPVSADPRRRPRVRAEPDRGHYDIATERRPRVAW